ncbi:MAG TPA: nitroreductase family protein [Acidimicrobiales bacterium]|nr:nitroreductase family protein [Acidimicrobiales bacterium]
MEFQAVVRARRMVRNFDPERPVDHDTRERILANALRAPSAGFSQGFEFLVCESCDERERFWQAATPEADRPPDSWLDGMRRAPLLVVPLSDRDAYLDRYAEPDKGWTDRDEARWPVPYWYIDTGFAALLMLLTAVDAGLGACFFGIVPERVVPFREAFGVPARLTPIGALTIGYRAPDRRSPSLARGRRPLEGTVHRGRYSPAAASSAPDQS